MKEIILNLSFYGMIASIILAIICFGINLYLVFKFLKGTIDNKNPKPETNTIISHLESTKLGYFITHSYLYLFLLLSVSVIIYTITSFI